MNNITVERVLNAYNAGVVKPGFEGWGNRECGCALTAVAINEKRGLFPTLTDLLDKCENIGTHEICTAIEITWPYMLGFTDAFDGCEFGTSDQEANADVWEDLDKAEYHMGYDHGKVVRTAVLEQYFPTMMGEQ